jgi:hypothetical protein
MAKLLLDYINKAFANAYNNGIDSKVKLKTGIIRPKH